MITSRKKPTTSEVRAVGLIIGSKGFSVCLSDGRQIFVPFHCFPRLDMAIPCKREHFEVCAGGRMLHWPEIDEDIEVKHIVEGRMPIKEPARAMAVAETRGTYVVSR